MHFWWILIKWMHIICILVNKIEFKGINFSHNTEIVVSLVNGCEKVLLQNDLSWVLWQI